MPDAESTSVILGWFERGKTLSDTGQTFVAGVNLDKFSDPRFINGVDEKVELSDERAMALLCHENSDFCGLNQLFWNAPFWRETQNGLVVAGEILPDKYRLVLLPTDNHGRLLRGEEKLAVINRVRQSLKFPTVSIGYGYDTIILKRN